jgi:epidermal growth factor receptor substrate 15
MRSLLFFFLFGFMGISNAQDLSYVIKGKVTNQESGINEGGVTVTLKRNGSVVASATTSSSGNYSLKASGPQGAYELVYSKSGMVTKRITFDGSGVNVEDLPAGNELPIPALDIDLFSNRPNADFSFLDSEAVASFTWDSKKMALDYDRVASERVKKKINDLLLKSEKEGAENELNYQKAIQAADALVNQKNYEAAVTKYEEALGYKPKESYPAQRIVELEGLIQAQKQAAMKDEQANSEYNNLIKAGDNLRDQGDLQGAITKYQEALAKKSEQYPKDQIAALKLKIEQKEKEAANDAAYKIAVEKGDMFLKQNSLKTARDKFTEASLLKPSENYPKQKLKEIDDKLKAQEEGDAKKKLYEDAIAAADASFNAQDFVAAKTKYEEALSLETSATYPKERIKLCNAEIEKNLAEKAKQEQITKLLAEGNSAFLSKDLTKAKASFEGVLALQNDHPEALQKLATVNDLLKKQEADAQLNAQFDQLVKDGDLAVTTKKFENAILKYQEAIQLKNDPAVQQKLKSAQDALKAEQDLASKKQQYDEAVQKGNELLAAKDFTGAKAKFEQAQTIDPSQQVPKDKLKEIASLMASQAKEEQYNEAVQKGNELLAAKDLAGAKAKFEQAQTIDPTQQVPKDKLKEIASLMTLQAKEEQYNAIITLGDQLQSAGKLEDAKKKYEEATVIDASKAYPKEQIAAINAKLGELSAEKAREEKYKAAISKADQFFTTKKWKDAVTAYKEAITFASDPSFAEGRIREAELKIGEEEETARKQMEFNKFLGDAKNFMSQKNWSTAKSSLESALGVIPGNAEASGLLTQVNAELAKQQSAEQQLLAFEKLKQEGTERYDAKDYQAAKLKYNEALTLKEDQTIRKKLGEIDAILSEQNKQSQLDQVYNDLLNKAGGHENQKDWRNAIAVYKEASVMKPLEAFPKEKIAFLEAKIAAEQDQEKVNAAYTLQLQKGDALMAQKKYLDAIKEYNLAHDIKPNEREPIDKAAEAERLERDKSTEVDAQYEKILTVAQTKIDESDYSKAKELLDRAIGLKPDDSRPKTMLAEMERKITEDAKYKSILSQAGGFEAAKNYASALEKYNEALSLRPSESLPKEKAEEMRRLLDLASNAQQTEQLYKNYMLEGDKNVSKKEYEMALSAFQNALSAKPGDIPAQNKINEVQQILDDLANSEKSAIDRKNKFDAFVKEGDALFSTSSYLDAIKKYEEALKIDPSSKYVKKQIEESVRLEKEKGRTEGEREYRKLIEAADNNFNISSYDKAKELYKRALNFKAGDPYPKQRLAEIEAILNPVTVESVKLEDLGEPFLENSIMDGQALLEKAEAERKLINSTKAKKDIDIIYTTESEMTLEKTADQYDNSNQIYQVQQKVSQDAGESDLNREATIEALRVSELERQKAERETTHYEHAENQLNQDVLHSVNREVALQYGEDIQVYLENADVMEIYNRAQAEKLSAEMIEDKDKNISADQTMSTVKLKVDQDVRDDIDERNEVTIKVFEAETKVLDRTSNLESQKYEHLLNNKDELRQIALNYEEKYVEDARSSSNNEEELKIIRKDKLDKETDMNVLKDEHLKKTDAEITAVKLQNQSDSKERDEARQATVEIIKDGNKELADVNFEAYNAEMEKYVSNKGTINEQVNKNNGVSEKADRSMELKIAYVEGADKRARIDHEEIQLSDEDERLGSRKKIETIYGDVEASGAGEGVKLEENTTRLNDLTRTMDAEKSAEAIGENEKLQNNAGTLSKIDNTPKQKVRVANELGQEYPEGVSQESFTNKDQNGLMTAIITRRIVVIDGKADVYVRTQNVNSVTYSKNGAPTLEHVWNKETQGPHLERHY